MCSFAVFAGGSAILDIVITFDLVYLKLVTLKRANCGVGDDNSLFCGGTGRKLVRPSFGHLEDRCLATFGPLRWAEVVEPLPLT